MYIFCSMYWIFKDLGQRFPTLPIKSLWICVTAACLNMSEEAVQCVAQRSALLTPPTATRVSVSVSSNVHLSQLVCLCVILVFQYLLVVTSLIISDEAWHPLTICLVQRDRSLVVSARNRWASIPSRVPVRVAKYSSVPECGDPRSGPEWTRLDERTRDKTSWFLCLTEPVPKTVICCYMLFLDQTKAQHKN